MENEEEFKCQGRIYNGFAEAIAPSTLRTEGANCLPGALVPLLLSNQSYYRCCTSLGGRRQVTSDFQFYTITSYTLRRSRARRFPLYLSALHDGGCTF